MKLQGATAIIVIESARETSIEPCAYQHDQHHQPHPRQSKTAIFARLQEGGTSGINRLNCRGCG
jgi:hypothetical protein